MILNSKNREAIVERLDLARRNRRFSYEKVGKLFGITQAGANNAFKRKSLNENKVNLLVNALGVNEEWLLSGNGEMFLTEVQVDDKKRKTFPLSDNYQVIEEMNTVHDNKHQYDVKGVPFFDVEFKAGFDLLMENAKTTPEYIIYDPIYKGCDAVVPAFGGSMMPVIYSGDKIGIKQTSIDNLLYGEIYAIITEDWRTIKYVRKSTDDSKIRLIPENLTDYDKQDIEKSKVLNIFLIKAISRGRC